MKNLVLMLAVYSKSRKIGMSTEDLLKAWNEGEDFKIIGGPYCSIRDKEQFIKDGFNNIIILALDGTDDHIMIDLLTEGK